MKRAAIFAMAAAMVLSLAACGNRDNKNQGTANNAGTNSGMTNGSGTNNSGTTNNGTTNNKGTNNSGTANNGGLTGSNSMTGNSGSSLNNSSTANNSGSGRSVGNDLGRAADGVGDAVEDLWDDGRRAVDDLTHSTSSFQRMLDNAKVHDTDGVLTDGENSRW